MQQPTMFIFSHQIFIKVSIVDEIHAPLLISSD